MKNEKIILAIVMVVGIIISTYILGNAYKYKFKANETIEVTGLAKKDFESDLVRWSASFKKNDMDLKLASEELNKDKQIVKQFLRSKGIVEKEIIFDAIDISKDFTYIQQDNGTSTQIFNGYILTQSVSIESKNLNKIDEVSREVSSLISQGIELNSNSPAYYFSKLEDLKLELISQATENAKKRAENISDKAGSSLGNLLNAKLGIFQITGQNDSEEDFSSGGVFNTKSRKKTANITVKLIFKSN